MKNKLIIAGGLIFIFFLSLYLIQEYKYKQNVINRFEELKDTAIIIAEGENCSNISWQECLYNHGEGIKYKIK